MSANAGTPNAPTNDDKTQNSNAAPNDDDKGNSGTQAGANDASSGLTREDLEAALGGARAEEKAKLYDKIKESAEAKAKADAELAAKQAALEAAQAELDTFKKSKLSTEEKEALRVQTLDDTLVKIQAQNEALKAQMEAVADAATAQIMQAQVDSYRERKIREADLTFAKFVTGNTPEEIDASIAEVKAEEGALKAKAVAEAKKKFEEELQKSVPGPQGHLGGMGGSHGGDQPPAPAPLSDHQQRLRIARQSPEEFTKTREKLMSEARAKAGW